MEEDDELRTTNQETNSVDRLKVNLKKKSRKHVTNVLLRYLSMWCSTQARLKGEHITLLISYTTTAFQPIIVLLHSQCVGMEWEREQCSRSGWTRG